MNRSGFHHSRRSARGGYTTPMVAVALVVAMGGLALILDRLWLEAADLELTTAAEAAALAAAGELASDDLLNPNADLTLRLDTARSSAVLIASQNVVAGAPVVLNSSPQGDIRFGRLVLDEGAGQVRFEETNVNPTSVVVTAARTRATSNPVGLFVSGLTGVPFGDTATRVEATIDNRVIGVRPEEGAPVPALPLAIWWHDPAGLRSDTWQQQIERRGGADNYGYDSVGRRVYNAADGIPEIVLHSQGRGQQPTDANVVVVDLGTGLNDQELGRQFTSGWTSDDLSAYGGKLQFVTPSATTSSANPLATNSSSLPANTPSTTATNTPVTLRASAQILHADREALDTLIGEPRICLLYSMSQPSGTGELVQTACLNLVAIRVLSVSDLDNGSCEIIAQPCVMATKTALLDVATPPYFSGVMATAGMGSSSSSTEVNVSSIPGNPYLYKLQLTH